MTIKTSQSRVRTISAIGDRLDPAELREFVADLPDDAVITAQVRVRPAQYGVRDGLPASADFIGLEATWTESSS